MKNLILSVALLAILSGCCCVVEPESEQFSTLIFQSEYTNYAWGYNHNGWMMRNSGPMMGNSGEVKRFQKNASWVFPDAQGSISEADMLKNLAACDSFIAKVATGDFSKYASMALTCADGPMSKAENKMADAGEHIWAFYTYDSVSKRYQRVILDMTGDWSQQNLATKSKEVVEWMKTIK